MSKRKRKLKPRGIKEDGLKKKLREVILKPLFIFVIYSFLRAFKYLNNKPNVDYTGISLIRASTKAVEYKKNYFVRWFYPRVVEAWVKLHAFDNAYNYFWKKTQKEYFKIMIRDKAPYYKEFWRKK